MKIKNWKRFQHFKDRRPPWIKLYRDLLDDDEWHELDPVACKVLIGLWLLASEDESTDGNLPSLKKIAFRLHTTERLIKTTISKLNTWLEQDDINLISSGYQVGLSETETETRDRDQRESTPLRASVVDEEFWSDLGANPAYQHINLTVENGKMDAWLALPKNKHRKKTRQFALNWLNKIEKPLITQPAPTNGPYHKKVCL